MAHKSALTVTKVPSSPRLRPLFNEILMSLQAHYCAGSQSINILQHMNHHNSKASYTLIVKLTRTQKNVGETRETRSVQTAFRKPARQSFFSSRVSPFSPGNRDLDETSKRMRRHTQHIRASLYIYQNVVQFCLYSPPIFFIPVASFQ